MGKDLYDNYAIVRAIFDSSTLDFDVKQLCFEGLTAAGCRFCNRSYAGGSFRDQLFIVLLRHRAVKYIALDIITAGLTQVFHLAGRFYPFRHNPDMKFMIITNDVKEANKFLPGIPAYNFDLAKDYSILKNARYLLLANSSFA